MTICNKDCIPCCDFCIHSIQEIGEINDKIATLGPIGCKLHADKDHQDYAKGCCYCEDFYCFEAE